jgi:predicted transcriptional regulator YdeE
MLKIGEFSKLAQVSPKTLRLYDERGLLKPAWIDRWTGYRYYRVAQLAELNRILAFKDLGFSLDQIAALQRDDLQAAELRGMIRLKQAELEQHIQDEQARLARIEARLQLIEQEERQPDYEVVLKSVPPLRVAGIRLNVPTLGDVDPLIEELQTYLHARGITPQATTPPLAVYYDAVFRERGLDLEVALPVHRRLASERRVQVHELPGVETMACVLHHGPYAQVSDAYQALVHWVDSSGYEINGPNRDVYLQRRTAHMQEEAVTEVQFPIKAKPFLSIVPSYKEHKRMEIKIVTKPAFTVAGMEYFGKNENSEIAQMWGAFNPRFEEIADKIDPLLAYGVCGELQEDGRFRYLAGFQVEPESAQLEDMRTWDVPEQTYAVFPCTLQTIHETYQYAFQTWLPQSDYEHAPGPDFELYHEDFNPEDGTGMSVYIPVKKKQR